MRCCTPFNHTAAMLNLSDQSDPDLQRYLRHTHTDRHTQTQTEIYCFHREMIRNIFYEFTLSTCTFKACTKCTHNYITVYVVTKINSSGAAAKLNE